MPSDTPGFTAEKAYDKLGWHASDTHPLSFSDAHVPESNLLGERGRGFAQFLATLDDGRVAIAALAVGCIQACLDMSVEYAGERTTFGVPIGRKQGVAFQIADLEVMLAASRQLTYRAAWMKDAGKRHRQPSASPAPGSPRPLDQPLDRPRRPGRHWLAVQPTPQVVGQPTGNRDTSSRAPCADISDRSSPGQRHPGAGGRHGLILDGLQQRVQRVAPLNGGPPVRHS